MITPEILAIVMFLTTLGLLLFGFPVAFTLAGSALLFGFLGDALEVFNFRMMGFFPQRIFGTMINEPLVAVPLFIFMGIMLEKSKIAEDLLISMGQLFGPMPGGLGISSYFCRSTTSGYNRYSWGYSCCYGINLFTRDDEE